jgi:hypothetical protein
VNDGDSKLPAKPLSDIGLTIGSRVHKRGGYAYGMIVKSVGNCHWEVEFDDPELENEKVMYNQLIHDRKSTGPPERLHLATSFSRPVLAMDSTDMEVMLVVDDDDNDSNDDSEYFDNAEAADAESD